MIPDNKQLPHACLVVFCSHKLTLETLTPFPEQIRINNSQRHKGIPARHPVKFMPDNKQLPHTCSVVFYSHKLTLETLTPFPEQIRTNNSQRHMVNRITARHPVPFENPLAISKL